MTEAEKYLESIGITKTHKAKNGWTVITELEFNRILELMQSFADEQVKESLIEQLQDLLFETNECLDVHKYGEVMEIMQEKINEIKKG